MNPLAGSKSSFITLGIVTVLLGAVGFLPLFGGPGYEFSLACGIILPSAAAIATAFDVLFARRAGHDVSGLRALERGVALGVVFSIAAVLIATLHGARVGFCAPTDGYVLMLVGPLFGAVAGGAWGAVAAFGAAIVEPRGRRLPSLLWTIAWALLGPLFCIGISIWRFYSSPMVFAFDPFFGYFAGPLYDTVLDPLFRLATYRLGTLSTLLGLLVVALHVELSAEGRVVWRWIGRPGTLALGAVAWAASVAVTMSGPELHHYSTNASIERALGRGLSYGRCDVVYSKSLVEYQVRLFARECDAHVRQIEDFFEMKGPERIHVYLFASPGEKGALMGAATTYIAKPWRREIYVQSAEYPHPVLGHELVHVVAGAFGQGPFRVAGPFGGWIPDPGRIEGVAVAGSPSDSELSLAEWALAMKRLELLPPLGAVFRLTFLGQNSSTAYTVAGSFVAWLKQEYGADVVRRWYGGDELSALTAGKDLAALEIEWHRFLDTHTLDDRALHVARARFDRPAIFGRRCPHAVDELRNQAYERLANLDPEGARQHFVDLLELDPDHVGARIGLGTCALRSADVLEARRLYAAVADSPRFTPVERANAAELLGDVALWAGEYAAAEARYRSVMEVVVSEHELRNLEVKRDAPALSALGRQAVVELLVGAPRFGASWDVAAPLIGRWWGEERSALASYLIGKNLYHRGRYREAARYLDRALSQDIDSRRVAREALRVRLLTSCALADVPRVAKLLERLRQDDGLRPTQLDAIVRLAERCGVRIAER